MKVYELRFDEELKIKTVIKIKRFFRKTLAQSDQNKTIVWPFIFSFHRDYTICRICEDLLPNLEDFLKDKLPYPPYRIHGYWEYKEVD